MNLKKQNMKNKKGNIAVIAIIIVIVAIFASVITWFITKKAQTPITQVQPAIESVPAVSVTPQSTTNQSAEIQPAQQPAQQPEANTQTENKIVYTNNEYKFKITLPKEYKNYKAIEQSKDLTDNILKQWEFKIKTTAKEYAPDYYEPSFYVVVVKSDIWDKANDCAKTDWRLGSCYTKENILGKRNGLVFYWIYSQDRSDYGLKVMEDFVFSQKIKQNFQLF